MGIGNCSSVLPFIATERNVVYRERFAGMYSSWAYSFSQKIPVWWVWGYWICPLAWSLKGALTSQYGDVEKEIVVHGEQRTISAFLGSIYGYNYDDLGVVAIVLLAYPLVFALVFACATEKINFQRR
ncbi:hypothetical protein ACE6H2_012313 [Prunus campanulata]